MLALYYFVHIVVNFQLNRAGNWTLFLLYEVEKCNEVNNSIKVLHHYFVNSDVISPTLNDVCLSLQRHMTHGNKSQPFPVVSGN